MPAPEHLSGVVQYFWVLKADADSYLHRSMADVNPEMIFHYKGTFEEIHANGKNEKSFLSGIHGQSNKISLFKTKECFGIFGIYLYPYSLPILFNIPSLEVTNKQVDLLSFLGKEGVELEDKMVAAHSNTERISIIVHFFEKKLQRSSTKLTPLPSAVHLVQRMKGNVKVRDLASKYYLSERQFERNFKEFTGISPKLFSRIVRFHAAFAEYRKPGNSLTKIALDCGYYDQSHLIQDCKKFSGDVPKLVFSGSAEGLGWMGK